MLTENIIIDSIKHLQDPVVGEGIEAILSKIIVKDGHVMFSIKAQKMHEKLYEELKDKCQVLISKIKGVKKITITLTEETVEKKVHEKQSQRRHIIGVKKVIVVASGKGGVGKSTIAANIAAALSGLGKKVGIVDIDIYGPSLPKLFAINKKPVLENNKMIPIQKYGLNLMSVGFLVNETDALVWRGPMATKMLYQLIGMTEWAHDGELDFLIIDTPPGTGDVHLSLLENYKVDGAVIVTTPQALAISDVIKGIDMFRKFQTPIVGIVDNMSYLLNAKGAKDFIFGKSPAAKLAKKQGVKLLGEIPIDADLNKASEAGKPLVFKNSSSKTSETFFNIAKVL